MSETALKSAEELKMERTVAKRAFSRLANNLLRTYEDLSGQNLENGFNAVTKAAGKVFE